MDGGLEIPEAFQKGSDLGPVNNEDQGKQHVTENEMNHVNNITRQKMNLKEESKGPPHLP